MKTLSNLVKGVIKTNDFLWMYAVILMKLKYQKTSNMPCQSDEFLHEKVVHKLGSTVF